MAPIESWNRALFALINADAGSPLALLVLARILAEGAPVAAAGLLTLLWVRRGASVRFSLLDATLTALAGLALAQVIARLWAHPRPFELGLGHQFLPHTPEASFPSDHATLLCGLALPLLLSASTRQAGVILAALAIGTAWARVYLGVHFPFDMAGGLAVAGVATIAVRALKPLLHGAVYPRLDRLYEALLARLRLPIRLFPRAR